jgi:hypothetical protein
LGFTRSRVKASLVTAFLAALAIVATFGAVRGPGKYNGVVIFDRWGACHLYSGVYLMEISEMMWALA